MTGFPFTWCTMHSDDVAPGTPASVVSLETWRWVPATIETMHRGLDGEIVAIVAREERFGRCLRFKGPVLGLSTGTHVVSGPMFVGEHAVLGDLHALAIGCAAFTEADE
jgi:hypothetical protein